VKNALMDTKYSDNEEESDANGEEEDYESDGLFTSGTDHDESKKTNTEGDLQF